MINTKLPKLISILIIFVVLSACCYTTNNPIIENTQVLPTNQVELTRLPTSKPTETANPTVTLTVPPSTPTETPIPPTASFPDPTGYQWSLIVNGLTRPVDIVSAFDNTGLIYIVGQVGVIRILKDGKLLPDPFLDIRDRVGSR